MPLKAIVDNLDDVPEHFHELYVEKNGKYEISGIEGMKTQADVDRLQVALSKERADHKMVKDKFAPLADRDPSEILKSLDRIPELEAAATGKLDQTKLDELVETRVKGRIVPIEREKATVSQKLAEAEQRIQAFESKETTRTIHDKVREAIGKTKGFQPSAVEDALVFAERMLEIDEGGKVVTRDNIGVTPGVDPTVWLTDMQVKKPHWWGTSEGTGALGNRSNNSGGSDNPWSHEGWNMTLQGQQYRQNPARAEQMAKAAGTTIGGKKPEPKKK